MKIEGRHHWKIENLEGEVLAEEEHSNVTTDIGLDTIVGLIAKVSGSEPILAFAFGIGATKGLADTSSTRSMTKDSVRTEPNNYWRYADITYTSGLNAGSRRRISSSSFKVLNHSSFPYIPAEDDAYVLTPHLGSTQLGNEPVSSGWRKAVEVEVAQEADHINDKNAVVRLVVKYSGSEAVGVLNECGLFTSLDPRGGIMIVGDGFADITRAGTEILTWVWELTLSR